ncbi:hypothetical protein N8E89_24330 (plasmid) [Phyllobacterium sp. A18/5-2]|uniref:hypothetical protein n=1 Tax=Phyllobacterium sp. A18/5-2 TaxID=2978392 RepID=UPI0021C6E88B|nr:hypothetical protein [Phyllobacterium sp. A18/5-2]UXN66298.1 hypothetical protein N8E89_24330 [Phyllobacterium sp. A18/5-2]
MIEDEKKQSQVVRRQLSQDDLRKAFRSQYNVRAPDDRFKKLLEQLEQAEKDQKA